MGGQGRFVQLSEGAAGDFRRLIASMGIPLAFLVDDFGENVLE